MQLGRGNRDEHQEKVVRTCILSMSKQSARRTDTVRCRQTNSKLLVGMGDGDCEPARAAVAGRTSHSGQAAATYPHMKHSHTAQGSSTEGMGRMRSRNPWTVRGHGQDRGAPVEPRHAAARYPRKTQAAAGSRKTAGNLPEQRRRPMLKGCSVGEWTEWASDCH